jgi:hypothetical protein
MAMRIIKRISCMLFGLVSGAVGLVSMLVSVTLMATSMPDLKNPRDRVLWGVWVFIICEILLAFGVAASLLGFRYTLGPKKWILGAIDSSWKKAMKYALTIPVFAFGAALIYRIVDWLAK